MEAATAPSPTAKSEFRNDSGGNIGVIVIENGQEKSLPLAPGDTIMLTAQEQILTANAPKKPENNPFTNGSLTLVTPAREIANRRPIGDPSVMPGAQQASEEEAEKARAAAEERKRQEAERAEAEKKRLAEAQKQAEQGAQPRKARPPAKSEGEGAVPAPTPEETAAKPQSAQAEGKRAPDEETG